MLQQTATGTSFATSVPRKLTRQWTRPSVGDPPFDIPLRRESLERSDGIAGEDNLWRNPPTASLASPSPRPLKHHEDDSRSSLLHSPSAKASEEQWRRRLEVLEDRNAALNKEVQSLRLSLSGCGTTSHPCCEGLEMVVRQVLAERDAAQKVVAREQEKNYLYRYRIRQLESQLRQVETVAQQRYAQVRPVRGRDSSNSRCSSLAQPFASPKARSQTQPRLADTTATTTTATKACFRGKSLAQHITAGSIHQSAPPISSSQSGSSTANGAWRRASSADLSLPHEEEQEARAFLCSLLSVRRPSVATTAGALPLSRTPSGASRMRRTGRGYASPSLSLGSLVAPASSAVSSRTAEDASIPTGGARDHTLKLSIHPNPNEGAAASQLSLRRPQGQRSGWAVCSPSLMTSPGRELSAEIERHPSLSYARSLKWELDQQQRENCPPKRTTSAIRHTNLHSSF